MITALLPALAQEQPSQELGAARAALAEGRYFAARAALEPRQAEPEARQLLAEVLRAQGLTARAERLLAPAATKPRRGGGLFGLFRGPEDVLQPGVEYHGLLDLTQDDVPKQEFSFEVPEGTVALSVRLCCAQADLDLYLSAEEADAAMATTLAVTRNAGGVEHLLLDSWSIPEFTPGRYQLCVEADLFQMPLADTERAEFSLLLDWEPAHVDAELRPGSVLRGRLDQHTGSGLCLRVAVPERAPALRIDVLETDQDLDLYADFGRIPLRAEDARYHADGFLGREPLLIQPERGPFLPAGDYYVQVAGYEDARIDDSPFALLASLQAEPPAEATALPPLPPAAGATPLERAAAAVVEIYTPAGAGSGTLVSSSGLVLTNAHVVSDYAEQPASALAIGWSLQPGRAPLELFRARFVHFDRALDLALLQIDATVYGQPLPDGYRFPALELGDDAALRLGDPLWALGYPVIGGYGTRNSLTLTRGVVCGFMDGPARALLKTDAPLTDGNSGGAGLDQSLRLIGIPTEVIENGAAALGYLVPVSALPPAWRATIQAAPR